jgi:hypothetical protein
LYSGRLTNLIVWQEPDPPPNALHIAFTHLKAVAMWSCRFVRQSFGSVRCSWNAHIAVVSSAHGTL